MDREIEFYMKIINKRELITNDSSDLFIWICHQIIELMQQLTISKDKLYIKNALILLLTLFEDYFLKHNHYNSNNHNKIPPREKEIFISILKEEFLA